MATDITPRAWGPRSRIGATRHLDTPSWRTAIAAFVLRIILIIAGVIFWIFLNAGLSNRSLPNLALAAMAAVPAVIAGWELRTGRLRLAAIQYAVVIPLWTASLLTDSSLSSHLGSAILIAILVGGLLIEEKNLHTYLVVGRLLYSTYLPVAIFVHHSPLNQVLVLSFTAKLLGLIAGSVCITTVRRALTSATDHYRVLVDSVNAAIVSIGEDGTIHTWNEQASKMFGYTAAEAVGSPITMLMPQSNEKIRSSLSTTCESATTDVSEATVVRRDGSKFPVEIVRGPMTWAGEPICTAIITDISARRAAERELERSHTALEDLVASKDRLIASVSHELRTPLTAILGFARLLLNDSGSLTDEERTEFHRTIAEQSAELVGIIEDLLVASRTGDEPIALDIRPLDLTAVVEEVVARLSHDDMGHIHVSGEAWVLGDELRVRQITRNLVTNAMRYGGSHCSITLQSDGESAFMSVSDDGPGIPGSLEDVAFEAFKVSSACPKPRSGSIGLGLAISRRLARLMDGDLQYRREGGWTRFELRLPRHRSDADVRRAVERSLHDQHAAAS